MRGLKGAKAVVVWAAAVLSAMTASGAWGGDRVAMTYDDLPALTQLRSQPYVDYANLMILRGLRHHMWTATGFVNEGKFDELDRARQIDIENDWLKAGMELGNHTFSHASPNEMTAQAYIEDIARGEKVTRPLLAEHGQTLRWFRHPYLETGTPSAVKARIDAWLVEHGYRIAPVTMENSDWLFAEPYDDAIARRDPERVAKIKSAYLDYTEASILWSQKAAHALFNRDFSFVFLLHVTRLNADCFEEIAAMLKAHHLHVISLERAMRDPAYSLPDAYVGKEGINWLERWSTSLHKELPWESYAEPPAWVHAEYDKVDSDGR